jgi:hypothetical protein
MIYVVVTAKWEQPPVPSGTCSYSYSAVTKSGAGDRATTTVFRLGEIVFRGNAALQSRCDAVQTPLPSCQWRLGEPPPEDFNDLALRCGGRLFSAENSTEVVLGHH